MFCSHDNGTGSDSRGFAWAFADHVRANGIFIPADIRGRDLSASASLGANDISTKWVLKDRNRTPDYRARQNGGVAYH